MLLKNSSLSVEISDGGTLRLCNYRDLVFELALLPLDCGFEQLFPYRKFTKVSSGLEPGPGVATQKANRLIFTKSAGNFQIKQTITLQSNKCVIKSEFSLGDGTHPRTLNLLAFSPAQLKTPQILISGGTMGEVAIKSGEDFIEGDLSKALMAIQTEQGAILLNSTVGSPYPLQLGYFSGLFQGMISLPPLLPKSPIAIGEIELSLGADAQIMLEEFASLTGKTKTIRSSPKAWNSWDFYHSSISHKKIMENAQAIATRNVLANNIEYVVMDMGWEIRHGEWEADCNFPHGMEQIAKDIMATGRKPGLWFAPVIIDPECNVFQDNYDFVGKNNYGFPDRTYECCGLFGYILDVTREEGANYLRDLFKKFRKMGYSYFKLDFLRYMMYVERFSDGTLSNVEVMQKALQLIREGAGEDAYILACNLPFEVGPGYCDACRVSKDVAIFWDSLKTNAESICASYFFNNNWWTNDPDFFVVRGRETANANLPLYRTWWFPRADEFAEHAVFFKERHDPNSTISYSEAQTYASLVLMLGGAIILGDPIMHLNKKGLGLLEKVLTAETAPGRPLNLFQDKLAKVWLQKLSSGLRIALFNWEDEPQVIVLDVKELGLENECKARNFWTDEQVELKESSEFLLHPRSALVFELNRG